MKKILLLALNARYSHTNPALYYLREYCKDLPYEFSIMEFSINRSIPEILTEIGQDNFDAIAISVYIWNSNIVKQLLIELKEMFPECKIILGGPDVSYNPEIWLIGFGYIDYIVSGAGEKSFRYLIENNFQYAEKVIRLENPRFCLIPFPYTDRDFDDFSHKYIYYEASRGCPYRCSYCLSSRRDQKLEYRGADQVKNELLYLISKKPDIVKFVDRTFNADTEFAREIWSFLLENHCPTRFHFEVLHRNLREEDFNLLEKFPPGYIQFEIGIQSTNPDALREIERPVDWEMARQKVQRLILQKNIRIHLDLIAGLPCDSMHNIINSFNDIYKLYPDYLQLGFLKVLPGTKLYGKRDEYGLEYDTQAPYQIISNRWLNAEELASLRVIEKLVNHIYNSRLFTSTLRELESLYPDPYSLFKALALFWQGSKVHNPKRKWQKLADKILLFIRENYPEKAADISGCLQSDKSRNIACP